MQNASASNQSTPVAGSALSPSRQDAGGDQPDVPPAPERKPDEQRRGLGAMIERGPDQRQPERDAKGVAEPERCRVEPVTSGPRR